MDRIYCYPNSNVLINKLNIKDCDKLCIAERKLTAIRLQELFFEPIQGQFDLNHLCDVHKHIFQDVYTWAGELRTVDIAKGNLFCKVQFIEAVAKDIFLNLKKDGYLVGLSKTDFIKKAAYYTECGCSRLYCSGFRGRKCICLRADIFGKQVAGRY